MPLDRFKRSLMLGSLSSDDSVMTSFSLMFTDRSGSGGADRLSSRNFFVRMFVYHRVAILSVPMVILLVV